MADTKNGLPEGTDTIIEAGGTSGGSGRSGSSLSGGSTSSAGNATGGRTSGTDYDRGTDSLITATDGDMAGIGVSGSDTDTSGSTSSGGIRGMVGNVSTKAKDEAANRARGFVGDGLKSGSATLGNISTLISDTVEQIEEKLGPQYAGYARSASSSIQRYATTLENKNPDELVDDARELIRKSPGVAIAGAAVIGFGLVRLLKAGLPENGRDEGGTTRSKRNRSDI